MATAPERPGAGATTPQNDVVDEPSPSPGPSRAYAGADVLLYLPTLGFGEMFLLLAAGLWLYGHEALAGCRTLGRRVDDCLHDWFG